MQINGMLECSVLGFPPSLQAREAAQRQIPSTSFHGYFQSSHEGPEPPATSSVVQGKQGAISRDDSCGGLQPFHPPSPSPLMTASLEWVGSYSWGHGEGSEVIRDESRLAGGSAVTTAGEVSSAQAGRFCPSRNPPCCYLLFPPWNQRFPVPISSDPLRLRECLTEGLKAAPLPCFLRAVPGCRGHPLTHLPVHAGKFQPLLIPPWQFQLRPTGSSFHPRAPPPFCPCPCGHLHARALPSV